MKLKICQVAVNSSYKHEKWKIALTLLGIILAVAVYATTRIGAEIAKNQASTGLNEVSAYHIYGENLQSLYLKLLNQTNAVVTPWIKKENIIATDGLSVFYFCEISSSQNSNFGILGGGYLSIGGYELPNKEQVGSWTLNGLSPFANSQTAITDMSGFDLKDITVLSIVGKKSVISEVVNLIPAGFEMKESEASGSQVANKATEAMRLNLQVLAILSFVVAGLLVYNTISYLTLLRKREYSTLIALGASPKAVQTSLLIEAGCLALVGALLGSLIGELSSEFFFKDLMSDTVSSLYRLNSNTQGEISYLKVFIESLLLALATCTLSAYIAARSIKSEAPNAGFSYVRSETQNKFLLVPLQKQALVFFLGLASTNPNFLNYDKMLGFLSPVLMLAAGACLSPIILSVLTKRILKKTSDVSVKTAANQILMTPTRSSVACASLGLALGLSLAIGFFITSFRSSVENWIFDLAAADLFVSRVERSDEPIVTKDTLEAIKQSPAVKEYDGQYSKIVIYQGRKVLISAFDFRIAAKYNRLRVLEGNFNSETSLKKVLVSEPFDSIFDVSIGQTLNLAGYNLKIAAVVKDFTSDLGVIFVDNSLYQKMFPGSVFDSLSIYTDGTNIKDIFAAENVILRSKQELSNEVLKIFDRTLSLTYAIQIVALAVALLSLTTSLAMVFIERKHELATLFAIGASNKHLKKTITQEAVILASGGCLAALIIGTAVGLVLIFSVNKHFFGWSVAFSSLTLNILLILMFTIVVAFLCGRLIARNVKPSTLIEATRYS